MTYAQLGDFRISTIYKLGFEESDPNKAGFIPTDMLDSGLHLDARCSDGEHWYAIASVHYDNDENTYEIRSVGSRLMEALTFDNLDDIKCLVDYAYKLMAKEWNKRHPNEY